jgi:hypothetical protein
VVAAGIFESRLEDRLGAGAFPEDEEFSSRRVKFSVLHTFPSGFPVSPSVMPSSLAMLLAFFSRSFLSLVVFV